MPAVEGNSVPKSPDIRQYSSPFGFEIHELEDAWRIMQQNRQTEINAGPTVGVIGGVPQIFLHGDNCVGLYLSLNRPYSTDIRNITSDPEQAKTFELQLRTLIDDRLRVTRHRLYQVIGHKKTGQENRRVIAKFGPKEFGYASPSPINSKEELERELTKGLNILRIFVTVLYQTNGIDIPNETLIIAPSKAPAKSTTVYKHQEGTIDENLRQAIMLEERPNVTFADIGGQPAAVEQARLLIDQLRDPEKYRRWGIVAPRGILFVGEPGTGKTLTAKLIAAETQFPFAYVSAANIDSKWYGDPTKNTKAVFLICQAEAKEHGHCILFLDEVDSLASIRRETTHEATRKVLAIILAEIDGLLTEDGVTMISATNDRQVLDPAFLSRMSKEIKFGLPNPSGIADIFEIHLGRACQRAGRLLTSDRIDFLKIGRLFEGISGRDIEHIVQIILETKAMRSDTSLVTEDDIRAALNSSSTVQAAMRNFRKSRPMGFLAYRS